MTEKRKRLGSAAGRHMRTPVCTALVACDGANLVAERVASGICGKCAKAMEARNKPPKALKGEKVTR